MIVNLEISPEQASAKNHTLAVRRTAPAPLLPESRSRRLGHLRFQPRQGIVG